MPTSTGLYDTSTITYDQSSLSYDGFPVPLSGMPAVGVFVAWTGTPYEVNPTGGWTEISQYVRQITIRRGRQDDLQQFPPGAAQLVLDNNLRYFDPFNTSAPAPFNGNLVPRKQIKIVANWNGVEYPLFRGFVAGWPVGYTEAGLDSTVTVDCFDLMGLIGSTTIDRPIVEEYTLSLNPRYYWTFAESPEDNAWYDKMGSGVYWSEPGTITVNTYSGSGSTYSSPWVQSGFKQVPELKPAAQTQAIMRRSGNYLEMYQNGTTLPSGTPTAGDLSVSFIVTIDTTTDTSSVPFSFFGNGPTITIRSSTAPAGVVSVSAGSAPTRSESFGIYNLYGTKGAHIVVTYVLSEKKFYVYVDGQLDLTATGLLTNGTTGLFPLGYGAMTFRLGVGIQHLSLYDRALTTNEIRLLSQVMLGKWEMTTPNRATYYLAATPTPTALYNLSSSIQSTVSEIPTEPTTLIPALQTLADTEGGQLFVDKSGVLQFFGQNDVFGLTRCNTSQVTFTDTGTGVNYDNTPIRMRFDAEQVRNQITVNATDDQSAIATDSTSITTFGVAADVVETLLRDAVDAQSLASYRLSIYKNPKLALDPFVAKGQQDPTYNWPRLLGLELLDRVTFKRTPATGSAIVKDLLVQSIEHRITPGEWQTVVNGSARYTNWFIVGVSLIGGDDLLLN